MQIERATSFQYQIEDAQESIYRASFLLNFGKHFSTKKLDGRKIFFPGGIERAAKVLLVWRPMGSVIAKQKKDI